MAKVTEPQVLHLASAEQTAALQIQRDRDALGGRRLDETVPGGAYIGTDNRHHDAFGRPITVSGGVVKLASGVAVRDPQAGDPEYIDHLVQTQLDAAGKAPEPGTGGVEALGDARHGVTTFTGVAEASSQSHQEANLPGDPPGAPLPKEIQSQIAVREYSEMPENELEVEIAKRGIRGIKGTGEQREGSSKKAITREDKISALKEFDAAQAKK
jgi:hypothetical protein